MKQCWEGIYLGKKSVKMISILEEDKKLIEDAISVLSKKRIDYAGIDIGKFLNFKWKAPIEERKKEEDIIRFVRNSEFQAIDDLKENFQVFLMFKVTDWNTIVSYRKMAKKILAGEMAWEVLNNQKIYKDKCFIALSS